MEDLSLIARQLQREMMYGQEARQRLTSRTLQAEQKAYASSTIYGQKLIKQALGDVADRLKERMQYLRRGTGSVHATTVYKHLQSADLSVLALITMKVVLDVLGKESKPTLTMLTTSVGRAVETELRLTWYQSKDKQLYKKILNSFHSSTGTKQKATVFRLQYNRRGMVWKRWGEQDNHKVGCWLLDGLMETTGWLTKYVIREGKRSSTVMRYSQEFLGLKDHILAKAESVAFCLWPMVCPPNDWDNGQRGGYLTEEIRKQCPMVRSISPTGLPDQGEIPIRMLNNLQHQEYRLNPVILEVANWAFDNFHTIGKFKRDTVKEPPPRPREDATEEEIKDYKRRRRELEDYNAQLEQKNWRTTEVMYVANKYANEDRFWIPWSCDYRGRVYPLVSSLTPQGTDFDKSLLYFKQEGPANEYWLAFHCATTYGLDKATMADRVSWTRENTDLITAIATDPIGNRGLWASASEPWCFLAAATEYFYCCVACTKTTSGLPIGIDATCSGLQHLSAMTLDGEAAALVNVTPTAKPADGYKTVAEASLKYITDETVHPFINRKTTKRTVMTTPYGVTRDSARGYIREQLKEDGLDLSVPGRLNEITKAVFDKAVPEVFAGPVEVMRWLQRSAKQILEIKSHVQWTSPSGFVVKQDLRESETERVKTHLMGAVLTCNIRTGWGDPDAKHHVSALAPNLVHSYDSALIHLTFADWDRPFTVIHDCVLGRSCDMDDMSAAIRHHFVEMYSKPVLADWADQVGVTLPSDLMKNTLDIAKVNESTYFFC